MIEVINKLIKNGDLKKAIEIINEEIANSDNIGTDLYYDLFFVKARIYLLKYKEINPLDNNLIQKAKEYFAHGDNAYNALYGKHHPEYQIAIDTANKIFNDLNQSKNK